AAVAAEAGVKLQQRRDVDGAHREQKAPPDRDRVRPVEPRDVHRPTPHALPNAHESATLPTHKARSSQTVRRPWRAGIGCAESDREAFAALHAELDLRLVNVLFLDYGLCRWKIARQAEFLMVAIGNYRNRAELRRK